MFVDYLYTTDGRPQGFRLGDYIYAMDGAPVGKVFAEKAYRLDGTYVGAVVNNMVLDKPDVSRRSMRPHPAPPRATLQVHAESRRPIGEAYPDCFTDLMEPADALTTG